MPSKKNEAITEVTPSQEWNDLAVSVPVTTESPHPEVPAEPAEESPVAAADTASSEAAPPKTAAPAELKTVEAWAAERNTQAWQFAAAKMHAGWPIGREVTAEAFDAAVHDACNVISR